jgi:hypothetical protein
MVDKLVQMMDLFPGFKLVQLSELKDMNGYQFTIVKEKR